MQVLGYSAIISYSSALSSILQVSGIEQIGEHILVTWLMKSVFNLRSPQPRYSKMWDVIKVQLYLKRFGWNEDLTLCQSTLNTAILLPILAVRRLHISHQLETLKMDISDIVER